MNQLTRFVVLATTNDPSWAGSDCDCACPMLHAQSQSVPLDLTTVLRVSPQQQQIQLDSEYTVVFIPSLSQVAVLNNAALELLQRFRTPQSLTELDPEEQTTIQRFVQLRLLSAYATNPAPPPPADELIAWLHVTNMCNLRCSYCYVDKTDEAMSLETATTAIQTVLRSAQQHGYQRLMLKYAGGEASLNFPLIKTMHRMASEQAQAAGITLRGVVLSNGVGLTYHKLKCIRDLDLRLMISLDGLQEVHDLQRPRLGGQGSFQAVIASIERAQAMNLDIIVSVTVTGVSVTGLPQLLTWLLDRDVRFSLNLYRECDASSHWVDLRLDEQRLIEGMRAAYQVIAERLPRYSILGCLLDRVNLGVAHGRTCAVGENYLVIDHQGHIAKCQMELKQSVTSIWADDPLQVIRLDTNGVLNLAVDEKEGCRDCAWKYWCAGGCAVMTYRATGRYDIQSPNCHMYQALYPDVIRLEGLRLLRWEL